MFVDVSKANRALGRMRKTFKYFNIQLFKVLYPAFVRTHLEFAYSIIQSIVSGIRENTFGICISGMEFNDEERNK